MRIKVTRIEIWEVQDTESNKEGFTTNDLHDSIQDDILNSQDSEHETDDAIFNYTPRELVNVTIEEVK